MCFFFFFFFFQEEDGIRFWSVTGVQTCALPISPVRAETTTLEVGGGWGRLGEVDATSDFVYTVTIGARGARSSFATSVSGGAGNSARGCRYAMTSASAIARSAAARTDSCRWSPGASRQGEAV